MAIFKTKKSFICLSFLIFFYANITYCMNNPTYTKLHENIYEINEQYFYSLKVHTYLIELNDIILLFDIPTYSNEVKEFILSFNKPAIALLSHGSCGIEDASTWQQEIELTVYAHQADEKHPWIRMVPDVFFTKVPHFDDDVEVIHVSGHSAGSVCLLHKPTSSLFTGDTIYGDETGAIRDVNKEQKREYEDLNDQLQSLHYLLQFNFNHIYPFHYNIIKDDAKQKLAAYLKKINKPK